MNLCIQCTRCVQVANEVTGAEELHVGTTEHGNDMQIGMYVEKTMDSELSGNIVDLCPVGALTSKPYVFHARPWEQKKKRYRIHQHHGLYWSNIRVDSRVVQVLEPTTMSMKGVLMTRRAMLTTPLIKPEQGDRFVAASWEEALQSITDGLASSGATGDDIQVDVGHLADTESPVALKTWSTV
jgi:NADH dehydrogenase (ubiquinone) Fe-S protein 1